MRGSVFAVAFAICVSATPAMVSAQAILEDFISIPLSHDGVNLWQEYPAGTQTVSIVSQQLRVVVPSSGALYISFFPYPYVAPGGFARFYVKSGTFDPQCNRLTFWIKPNVNVARFADGSGDMYVGTYSKPASNTDPAFQGRHFYHHVNGNFTANRWHKLIITRQPQHEVGASGSTNHPENPTAPAVNYFDGLTRWYFGDGFTTGANSTWLFDDVQFSTVSGEPDTEISNMKAHYTGTRYEVAWNARKNVGRTFEIRYKTSSMKPNAFLSGTDGGTTTNPGNDYTGTFWDSPNMAAVPDLYIAIRVQGQTAFSEIHLPASGPGGIPLPPSPPTNLRIQ